MLWGSGFWFVLELTCYALLLVIRAISAIRRVRNEVKQFETQVFGSISS